MFNHSWLLIEVKLNLMSNQIKEEGRGKGEGREEQGEGGGGDKEKAEEEVVSSIWLV